MESNSEKNKINMSLDAKLALQKQAPACRIIPRGEVMVKGKGKQELFFLDNSPEAMATTLAIPAVDTAPPIRRMSINLGHPGVPLVGRSSTASSQQELLFGSKRSTDRGRSSTGPSGDAAGWQVLGNLGGVGHNPDPGAEASDPSSGRGPGSLDGRGDSGSSQLFGTTSGGSGGGDHRGSGARPLGAEAVDLVEMSRPSFEARLPPADDSGRPHDGEDGDEEEEVLVTPSTI